MLTGRDQFNNWGSTLLIIPKKDGRGQAQFLEFTDYKIVTLISKVLTEGKILRCLRVPEGLNFIVVIIFS